VGRGQLIEDCLQGKKKPLEKRHIPKKEKHNFKAKRKKSLKKGLRAGKGLESGEKKGKEVPMKQNQLPRGWLTPKSSVKGLQKTRREVLGGSLGGAKRGISTGNGKKRLKRGPIEKKMCDRQKKGVITLFRGGNHLGEKKKGKSPEKNDFRGGGGKSMKLTTCSGTKIITF